MANNEDYLDSLLRAAATQNDPNSAINKVRELNANRPALEKEPEIKLEPEAEAASVIKEEPVIKEEQVIKEVPVIKETPAIGEPLSVDESSEYAGDDYLADLLSELNDESLKAKSESEPEASMDVSALLNVENLVVDASTLLEEETPATEETPVNDIDALLKSDFSGEIELKDVSTLLDEALKFAEEAPSKDTSMEEAPNENVLSEEAPKIKETTDEAIDASLADLNVDDLLSGLSDLVEQTDEEKIADEVAEATDNMSDKELAGLIDGASEVEPMLEEGKMEIDLSDIASLEGELGIYEKNDLSAVAAEGGLEDFSELDEISSLLNSIESNEVSNSDEDDMLNMLNETVSIQEEKERAEEMDKAKEEAVAEYEEFKAAKTKKEKKAGKNSLFKKKKKDDSEDASALDENGEPKKKSFIKKILEFITAEEESEEDESSLLKPTDVASLDASNGFEDVPGENRQILEEVDKEGEEKGKKKKKKKGKGKDKKEASDAEGEDGEESEGNAKGKKKKKKKEKIETEKPEKKPLILDIDTGKPLSKKNVKLIFIMAASLLVLIILFVKLVPGVIINSSARKAYYKGDYETTYNSFFGEKLSDSDQILFDRSEVILKMSHKYDAYEAYMNMDMKAEALDQLLQGVNNYEKWLISAETSGAVSEYNDAYAVVLRALSESFGLTETDAKAVNALETDLEYSLMVYSIVNGTEYIDPTEPLPAPFVPPTEETESENVYEDMLSEEGN